jgi:peptidyl-prolyl cis-trans isomerase D
MAKSTNKPVLTKKHLARVERERIQTRYILIVSGIVLALVVLLIGWGIATQYLLEPNQPVAKVNSEAITTRAFQAYARFQRGQIVNQYYQYQQLMQMFGGGDASTQSLFQQNLAQLSYQLEPTLLGQDVVDTLIQDRLIRAEAKNRGIEVTSDEIEKSIQDFFGFFPNGTPTPAPTKEVIPTSTISPLQLTLVAFTPTPTEQATTEAANPTPTTTLAPTPSSEPSPTPTAYTQDAYKGNLNNYLNYLKISTSDMRWIFETRLFREKLFEAITADVSKDEDQVWARQIVVADEATANEVKSRLDAGENFIDLVQEYTILTPTIATGGDLGWFSQGEQDPALETAAFNLEIGQASDPIKVGDNWEIILVLGHEIRQMSDTKFDQLRQQKFDEWLTSQRDASNVEIFELWKDRVPAEPTIPPQTSPQQ